MNYSELLTNAAQSSRSLVCMGADPVIERIPIKGKSAEESIYRFYEEILNELIDSGQRVSAIKPNFAFYAQYGFEGLRALKRLIALFRQKAFPVIFDAKRGDIGNTSAAYASEVFDFYGADAVTVSPYMGSDSLMPFVDRSKTSGKGVYILARTSNVGAADLQNVLTKEETPFFMRVIDRIILWGRDAHGNVGAVVGATSQKELTEIAEKLAKTDHIVPLLIPGVGTQGGSAAETISSIVGACRKADLDKSLIRKALLNIRINSSSSINYAYEKVRLSYPKAAAKAVQDLNEEINASLEKEGLSLY